MTAQHCMPPLNANRACLTSAVCKRGNGRRAKQYLAGKLSAPPLAQLDTPSPKKPASHMHAALPAGELECAGHAVQLDAPVSF